MSLAEAANLVAQAFVNARRSARVLTSYPGERPADLVESYRIQDLAIGLDGREVAGWKVGRINAPDDTKLGSNRLAGPIFADSVVMAETSEVPDMPVFAGGFAAAEAELLLHVTAGWDGRVPGNISDIPGLIDEVRLGIEIASSPYPGINADGPLVTASDFGNNYGLVMGPQLDGWQHLDLCAIMVTTVIDGQVVGQASAATMLDGPLGAVQFLLANLAERGIDASQGLWISTGAITGVHEVGLGQQVRAMFGTHGALECRIVAAQAA